MIAEPDLTRVRVVPPALESLWDFVGDRDWRRVQAAQAPIAFLKRSFPLSTS